MNTIAGDESESLSDIDDDEVIGYLQNEKEKNYKKIIWEEMNREYTEEQAAKEAAAAAAKVKEAQKANLQNCPVKAHELAAAAVAKSRKERQQKRAAAAENAAPALTKKRVSSKINYDVLDKLFDNSTVTEDIKQKRTESDKDDKGDITANMEVTGEEEEEPESGLLDNKDYEEDGGMYDDYYGDESSYYGNEEGSYGNDEDYNYHY